VSSWIGRCFGQVGPCTTTRPQVRRVPISLRPMRACGIGCGPTSLSFAVFLSTLTEILKMRSPISQSTVLNRVLGSRLNCKIDLHSHHVPPAYLSAISKLQPTHIDGIPISLCSEALAWTPEKQIQHQDALSISKTYLSISSPGTHLTPGDNSSARTLTRECNDWTFKHLCSSSKYGGRIGMFASLPLPDVDGSIEEIKRVEKDFGLSSFIVMTNSHGIYLGDKIFDKVWEELDTIKGLISLHPTAPCIRLKKCTSDTPIISSFWNASSVVNELDVEDHGMAMVHGNPLLSRYFDPLIEFQFETARALTSLLLSGSFSKFPNIRYLVPHAGGSLPCLLDRVISIAPFLSQEGNQKSLEPEEMRALLHNRCVFDLAGAPFPRQIEGLLPHLNRPSTQLVYGSDFREFSRKSQLVTFAILFLCFHPFLTQLVLLLVLF